MSEHDKEKFYNILKDYNNCPSIDIKEKEKMRERVTFMLESYSNFIKTRQQDEVIAFNERITKQRKINTNMIKTIELMRRQENKSILA